MTDSQIALIHIRSQVFEKWLPPPSTAADGLGPAFIPTGDWLDKDFWADEIGRDVNLTSAERHRVALSAAEHFRCMHSRGAYYVHFWSQDYPPLLRFTPDPPVALSVLGCVSWLTRTGVAVVGSRKATAFALAQAVALGKELARSGIPVVSGGALGCDIASHWGALAGGHASVPAIAVFAGGLDKLYPRRNQYIFSQISARSGAMVSERLWDAPSRPRDFPTRNRIISGVAPLTVVVQAGPKSGAYITARWALDQGREVCVLEHPRGDVRSSGSEALIEDGARAFVRPAQILQMCQSFLPAHEEYR